MSGNLHMNMYRGVAGEYLLISMLYRYGFDAMKLPVSLDKNGFDIFASNPRSCLVENREPEHFYCQVKTAYVKDFNAESDKRTTLTAEFYISKADISAVTSNAKNAFMFFVYDSLDNKVQTHTDELPHLFFWIGKKQVEEWNLGSLAADGKLTVQIWSDDSTNENTHWYAKVINPAEPNKARYLGTVKGEPSDDGAYHYSLKGFFDSVGIGYLNNGREEE